MFLNEAALPQAISSTVLPTALLAIWLVWSGMKPYEQTRMAIARKGG